MSAIGGFRIGHPTFAGASSTGAGANAYCIQRGCSGPQKDVCERLATYIPVEIAGDGAEPAITRTVGCAGAMRRQITLGNSCNGRREPRRSGSSVVGYRHHTSIAAPPIRFSLSAV